MSYNDDFFPLWGKKRDGKQADQPKAICENVGRIYDYKRKLVIWTMKRNAVYSYAIYIYIDRVLPHIHSG